MEYKIALASDLGITPEEFVAGWNEVAKCREAAVAHVDESQPMRSMDALLLAGVVVTLTGLASNISASAIYDLIKKSAAKKVQMPTPAKIRRQVSIMKVTQTDGTCLLVVNAVEEEL